MARSTADACYSDLRVSLSNGDAVIASTDIGSGKVDARASFDMDAIGVGTICWC